MITNPIWVVKTRMQLQMTDHPGNYKGMIGTNNHPFPQSIRYYYYYYCYSFLLMTFAILSSHVDAFTTTWREEGIRGLYKGLLPGIE